VQESLNDAGLERASQRDAERLAEMANDPNVNRGELINELERMYPDKSRHQLELAADAMREKAGRAGEPHRISDSDYLNKSNEEIMRDAAFWDEYHRAQANGYEGSAEAFIERQRLDIDARRTGGDNRPRPEWARDAAGGAEHRSGARGSTRQQHEGGRTRVELDRGRERADKRRRANRRRPEGWEGPWNPADI